MFLIVFAAASKAFPLSETIKASKPFLAANRLKLRMKVWADITDQFKMNGSSDATCVWDNPSLCLWFTSPGHTRGQQNWHPCWKRVALPALWTLAMAEVVGFCRIFVPISYKCSTHEEVASPHYVPWSPKIVTSVLSSFPWCYCATHGNEHDGCTGS